MSASSEQPNPQRSRIVISVDDDQTPVRMARPPRSGGIARILLILGGLLVVILCAVAIGGYLWWQSYKSKPAYSLALLVDAVQRNDMGEFDKLVNLDQIVENFVPQVTDRVSNGLASNVPASVRSKAEALVPRLMPSIKEKVRERVKQEVENISKRVEGKPFIIIAIALPYVIPISEEGDSAKAIVPIANQTVELTMKRNGDRWLIVAIKDDELLEKVAEEVRKSLPTSRDEAEKKVRDKLKDVLPGGLDDILK